MFKRPNLRPRENNDVSTYYKKPEPGTFLHDIITPKKTVFQEHIKAPIYQKEVYLALLKKNCESLGIPYIEPVIPDALIEAKHNSSFHNPIDYIDKIYMKIKYMKNGTVKIKFITAFMDMHNKYYKNAKKPPIKTLINAYKLMDFPEDFVDKFQTNYTKNINMAPIIFKKIESLLTKEPVKKTKTKKPEIKTIITDDQDDNINDDENDNDNDNDDEQEDEGLDMEIELDDDELVDPVEEEYFSDGGD